MSVVTGVMVFCSVVEDDDGAKPDLFGEMDDWLWKHGFGKLQCVENETGGSKHPQFYAAGAGYNFFPQEEFATFFARLPWEEPDNAVLVMQPETGATWVVRPVGTCVGTWTPNEAITE